MAKAQLKTQVVTSMLKVVMGVTMYGEVGFFAFGLHASHVSVLVIASFPSPATWKGRKASNVGPLEWTPKLKGVNSSSQARRQKTTVCALVS